MIKIFLDTNIFISGFFFDGNERKIVEHRSKNIKYFTSEQVTDEIESVLLNKFNVDNNTVKKYVAKIILEFVLIKPKYHLNIINISLELLCFSDFFSEFHKKNYWCDIKMISICGNFSNGIPIGIFLLYKKCKSKRTGSVIIFKLLI